eukprot:s734_g4.t1
MATYAGNGLTPEVVSFAQKHGLALTAQEELQKLLNASVSLAQRRVTVSVPATVANLGPGLEVVGMAVDIWDEFTLEFSDHFSVEIRGLDTPEVPRNEENLVVQGAASAFKEACRPFPTMHFICEHRIPYDKTAVRICRGPLSCRKTEFGSGAHPRAPCHGPRLAALPFGGLLPGLPGGHASVAGRLRVATRGCCAAAALLLRAAERCAGGCLGLRTTFWTLSSFLLRSLLVVLFAYRHCCWLHLGLCAGHRALRYLLDEFLASDSFRGNLLFGAEMNPPSSGSIPLTEYRRDVPPGWSPGDGSYSLRSYLEKLRLWYRICSLEDEHVGPVIAGRLYGRAHRIAVNLRVPRPDGSYDVGDSALVRLPVDEVRDPMSGDIIQEHIPSGVQFLVNALRAAFGQMDQDLATSSLESFFSLTRHGSKLSLSEYSVEFDSRYDEASDRAGLQLNDVGKFFLWFRGSGLPTKTIDDIKLQVNGDYTRFIDARALALRITPNKETQNDIFYGEDETWWDDSDGYYHQYYEDADDYDDGEYLDYDWWYGYGEEADGEWVYEYDDGYDSEWHEHGNDGEAPWSSDPCAQEQDTGTTSNGAEAKEDFYKGKGKGDNDGCFNCGSKWHMARDCPMSKGSGKKGSGGKGKGKWRAVWRPRKGKGKGKFRGKGYGKSYGKKGYGKGKNHWFVGPKNVRNLPLDFSEGVPDHTTSRSTASQRVLFNKDKMPTLKKVPERQVIHTSSEEDDFMTRRKPTTTSSATTTADVGPEDETAKPSKQHSFNFPTFHNSTMDGQYFAVRGEKRFGLLIDPGAASELVGSDTLLQLVQHCVQPAGRQDEMVIDHSKTVPVSGINGVSEQTLGQVTLPLVSGGHPITYTGDVLGGEGSFCPALVGNPALREMNAVIFANWFQNGDGLIMVGSQDADEVHHRMFRLLLTDSGHYMLPTDHDSTAKVSGQTKREVVLFCSKAASKSLELWQDVHPRVHHCFLSRVSRQTEGDRGENAGVRNGNEKPDEANNESNKGNSKMTKKVHFEDDLPDSLPSHTPDSVQHHKHSSQQPHVPDSLPAHEPDLLPQSHSLGPASLPTQPVTEPASLPSQHAPSQPEKPILNDEKPTIKDAFNGTAVLTAHEEQVSQPAILAKHDTRVSAHVNIKHNVLDEHNVKTPAEDEVSPDDKAILAAWSSEPYAGDVFPENVDEAKLNKRYKAIPEEYYSKSGLHPVTPSNFKSWFAQAKGRGLRGNFAQEVAVSL